MSSRRKLKKTIYFIAHELTMECYVNFMLMEDFSEKKMNEVLQKIYCLNNEYIARANHPNGKDDSKLIKAYYNKIMDDFNKDVAEIVKLLIGEKF